MIKIELDERSTFTYDPGNLSVKIWDHADGRCAGPIIGQVGEVKFADMEQVEMLEFLIKT